MAAAAGEESACRHALDSAAQEISYGAASEELPYLALNETLTWPAGAVTA